MITSYLPIAVIVPNYNSGTFLCESIASINNGIVRPQQIIIVDDCSTDGSYQLALKLAQQYQNILVKRTLVNVGAAGARKLAMDDVSSEYLCWLDADDLLEQGSLGLAYSKIADAEACVMQFYKLSRNGAAHQELFFDDLVFPVTGREACIRTLGSWRISSLQGCLAKTEPLRKIYADFDLNFINADELITRLFYNSIEKVNMCSGIYYQRENPQSTTRKISKKLIGVGYSFPWLYKFSVENGYSKIDFRLERYYWQETIKHMYWVVKRWPYWVKFKATADALKYLEISFFELSGYNYSLINYVADSEIKLNKRVGILFIRLLMLIVFVSVKVEKLVRKKHV
jgi:glycosyltransferase involved in cell wall biosynthesis